MTAKFEDGGPLRMQDFTAAAGVLVRDSSTADVDRARARLTASTDGLAEFGVTTGRADWNAEIPEDGTLDSLCEKAAATILVGCPKKMEQAMNKAVKELAAWRFTVATYGVQGANAEVTQQRSALVDKATLNYNSAVMLTALNDFAEQPLKLRRSLKGIVDALGTLWGLVNPILKAAVDEKLSWQRAKPVAKSA